MSRLAFACAAFVVAALPAPADAASSKAMRKAAKRSAPGAKERLSGVGIARSFECLGPRAARTPSFTRGARSPIPSDLLHLVIELQRVAVGIEHVGGVVDSRVDLRRKLDDAGAARAQELDRGAQLAPVRDLQDERHA